MLAWLNPLNAIAKGLTRAYEVKQTALTSKDRIAAEVTITQLEARQAVLVAEQGSWMTSWVRPAFGILVWIYWAKLIVWDTVLGLGTTSDPGEHVKWFVVLIPTAYFLVRPTEKQRNLK